MGLWLVLGLLTLVYDEVFVFLLSSGGAVVGDVGCCRCLSGYIDVVVLVGCYVVTFL